MSEYVQFMKKQKPAKEVSLATQLQVSGQQTAELQLLPVK